MQESDLMFLDSAPRYQLFRQNRATETSPWRKRLLIAIGIGLLAVVSLLIHSFTPFAWNVSATRALQSLKFAGLHELMRLISGFGNAPKVVAITLVALLACNKRREAVFVTLSGLGGWFLAMQLKHVFAAPRPTADMVAVFHQWPTGSFPSGHLVFYVCYFGFLFFVARRLMRPESIFRRVVLAALVLLIVMVGVSRVYLGEHWVSDLPGSYLLGAVWLGFSLELYWKWTRARARRNDWFLPYRTTE
jgi:membrane-associated phospholipid phosphatase